MKLSVIIQAEFIEQAAFKGQIETTFQIGKVMCFDDLEALEELQSQITDKYKGDHLDSILDEATTDYRIFVDRYIEFLGYGDWQFDAEIATYGQSARIFGINIEVVSTIEL